MNFPKVSIILSVKNEEKCIADLLDSIADLDYPKDKLETIAVDGGSTDKTLDILSRYPFTKLIASHCSLSEGKNIGIRNSTGEIVAIVDGDCIVDREWIKNIVKHFQRNSEIVIVGGPYLSSNQKELFAKYRAAWARVFFPRKTGFTKRAVAIGGGNVAYRRKIFEEVGFFNESLGRGAATGSGEDMDLHLRIMNLGYKLFYAEDVVVFHKFRVSLKEESVNVFNSGIDSSIYHMKYAHASMPRRLRYLLRPFLLPGLGLLFIFNLLSGTFLIVYVTLILFFCYYLYKAIRFYARNRTKMSLILRIVIPIIDIYIMLVWSLGALIGFVSYLRESRE